MLKLNTSNPFVTFEPATFINMQFSFLVRILSACCLAVVFAAITNPGAASSSSAGLTGGTGDDAPLITLRCLGKEPTVTDKANLKGGKQNDDVDKEEKKKKKKSKKDKDKQKKQKGGKQNDDVDKEEKRKKKQKEKKTKEDKDKQKKQQETISNGKKRKQEKADEEDKRNRRGAADNVRASGSSTSAFPSVAVVSTGSGSGSGSIIEGLVLHGVWIGPQGEV